jgi:hypothetical protein
MDGYLKKRKESMDMLSQGIKFIVVLFLLFLSGCKHEPTKEEIQEMRRERMEKSINKRNTYMSFAKKLMGEKEYYTVYKNANDSLVNWGNNIEYFSYIAKNTSQIDSLLCFNERRDKLITCILSQCNIQTCVQDDIYYSFGVKIKNNWYFFKGANITLPREFYQDNIHKPLSMALQ